MWFFPTKKEVKKEFNKIRDSFKERDLTIEKLKKEIEELDKKFISKKEAELMIREYLVQSEPNPELKSEPNRTKYERIMVQKAIKTRPEALKQAIRGLIDKDMRTTDIFKLIVEEKRLISKTQFYHYLSLVRNELRTGLRTELRTKQ